MFNLNGNIKMALFENCTRTSWLRYWIIIILFLMANFLSHCNSKTFFYQQVPSQQQQQQQNAADATMIPTTVLMPTEVTTTVAPNNDISIGPCTWAIGRKCPDKDIKYYLYTRRNMMDRQCLYIDETLEKSNLTSSYFNPKHQTKIIIHGYNSDMFLNPLHKMRQEYLAKSEYNIIYVDWSVLSPGPCYISAVHNTKHTGACVAQLVERILDYGSADIHVIGFSLGAQVPNYIARNLGSFLLPRITGLDPALPLFVTTSNDNKLDPSDAAFVDVIHTNALVQGKLERCGHVDFYLNGGIIQPGCSGQGQNPFACSHQRAPAYFLESIRSRKGFWGWACSNYIAYLLGMCPPTNYLVEAGENIKYSSRGMYLVKTNDTSPYALGKWTDLPMLGAKIPTTPPTIILTAPKQISEPLLRQVDQWGKLDSNFNNLEHTPTPYAQDPYADNWTYFNGDGTSEITNTLNEDSIEEENHSTTNDNRTHRISDSKNKNKRQNSKNNRNKFKNTNNDEFTIFEVTAEKPTLNWSEYRRNLTNGFIDNSVFKVRSLSDVSSN